MLTHPGLSQLGRRLPPKADWRWPCTCSPDGTDLQPVYTWGGTPLSGLQANGHTDDNPPSGKEPLEQDNH